MIEVADTHRTGVLTVRQNNELGQASIFVAPDEQRELLEALARHLGATVSFPEPAAAAWVVIDHGTGYNMLPCKLDVAQAAAGQARENEMFLAIASLTDAYRVACENHTGIPAYIIDHGNGAYSVIV